MQKRNFETKEYEEYSTPDGRNSPLFSLNMKESINCTDCWEKIEYWAAYTSKAIHSYLGFWYPVCESCYEKEIKAEFKSKRGLL